MKERPPSNAGIVIALVFVVAALGQCGRKKHRYDPCAGHRPVTIGGSMVVACH